MTTTIDQKTCIFCSKPLDGSDEHIIPDSINGKLHSKEIICHACNIKFGATIDTILSQTFSQFIHLIGLKNARTLYVEDPEGRKYTKDKKHKIKPIKPDLKIQKKDGLIYITISGDEKNAMKLLDKQKKVFLPSGAEPVKLEIRRDSLNNPPMSMEIKIDIDKRLILILNKIALEFYAYNGLDISFVNELLNKVGQLDFSLTNVSFCNLNQEVRTFEDCEISHLIALRTDYSKGILYCYIELFNLVCAVIVLKSEYTGPRIDIQHRQDIISGKRIDTKVELFIDFEKTKPSITREDLSILIDLFCDRHQDKIFMDTLDEGLNKIKEQLEIEIKNGSLKNEEYTDKFIKLSTQYVAYLTVYEFPYAVADFDDNQNEMVNYFHSSMKESMFEEFCNLNKGFIGFGIAFTSDQHDSEKCIVESFIKTPVGKRKNEGIVKVYCVLRNVDTEDLKYIPFRNLFEGLQRLKEENEDKSTMH